MGFQGIAIAQGVGQGLQNAMQLGLGAYGTIKGVQHQEAKTQAYRDRTAQLAMIKGALTAPAGLDKQTLEQVKLNHLTGVSPYQPTFTPNAAFLGTPSVTPTFQPSSGPGFGDE